MMSVQEKIESVSLLVVLIAEMPCFDTEHKACDKSQFLMGLR